MSNNTIKLQEAINAYFKVAPYSCERYGNGHINDTFLAVADKRYILQRMNRLIFTQPWSLMDNIIAVTDHIRNKVSAVGGDVARSTLVVVPTLDKSNLFCDSEGCYWRMYEFTENTVARERVESPNDFYTCARAFGEFQQMLSDFPADQLFESIKDFHNTPCRYDNLMKAVDNDVCARLDSVRDEVEFARARKDFCCALENARVEGRLPLRVTHNDTKLNNILFDAQTGEPVCVIDLDTVMPGYSVTDFGDSIRFGANTAAEDETDLSKVGLDLELFELYAKGFLEGCNGSLESDEVDLLPVGAMMMTLECGMRFLTDYLEGDVYFKIHRPNHNLDRARNQFALVADMEKKLPEMNNIIKKLKISKK